MESSDRLDALLDAADRTHERIYDATRGVPSKVRSARPEQVENLGSLYRIRTRIVKAVEGERERVRNAS